MPGRFLSENKTNLLEKIQRNLYMFDPEFCFLYKFLGSDPRLFEDVLYKEKAIVGKEPTQFKEWPILSYGYLKEALDLIFLHLKTHLFKERSLIVSDQEKLTYLTKNNQIQNIKGEIVSILKGGRHQVQQCAFCDSRKINDRSIVQGKFMTIFPNAYPYSRAHFLITPKANLHFENASDLPFEAVNETHEYLLKMVDILKKKHKTSRVVAFRQNGVAAGQTVPHTHIHVLVSPQTYAFDVLVLLSLAGIKQNFGLSLEEKTKIVKEYSKYFYRCPK